MLLFSLFVVFKKSYKLIARFSLMIGILSLSFSGIPQTPITVIKQARSEILLTLYPVEFNRLTWTLCKAFILKTMIIFLPLPRSISEIIVKQISQDPRCHSNVAYVESISKPSNICRCIAVFILVRSHINVKLVAAVLHNMVLCITTSYCMLGNSLHVQYAERSLAGKQI
jgi:hypothetical protein